MSEDKMDLAVDPSHCGAQDDRYGAVDGAERPTTASNPSASAAGPTGGGGKGKMRVMVGLLPERNGVPSAEILFDLIAIAQRGHPFVRMPYTRTDLARNSLAEHLLRETQFTHLLMLDADHRHPQDIVERLSRWVVKDPGRLVVAGMAFRRGVPFDPCIFMESNDGTGSTYVPAEWERGLMRVDLSGTAAMLISRKVFEQLPRPWFAYDYGSAEQPQYPGEDIWFCRQCQRAGIPIYVDTTTVSPHLLESWVNEQTFRSYLEAAQAKPGWSGMLEMGEA